MKIPLSYASSTERPRLRAAAVAVTLVWVGCAALVLWLIWGGYFDHGPGEYTLRSVGRTTGVGAAIAVTVLFLLSPRFGRLLFATLLILIALFETALLLTPILTR